MRGYTRAADSVAVGTVNKGKPTKPGYGVYFRDTSVRLDMETFAEVRQLAIKRGCSFGSVIRSLVELGLETERIEEQAEAKKMAFARPAVAGQNRAAGRSELP